MICLLGKGEKSHFTFQSATDLNLVAQLNFSSICGVEFFEFDNLSPQLQGTRHIISNRQIHA